MCKRGEIYNVNFGYSTDSHKQSGIRPAVIVSNNKANTNAPVVTIVPLTARVWKKKHLPTHVLILPDTDTGLKKPSMALAEQVGTLDKSRLGERVGEIGDEDVMDRLTVALQIQIGAYKEFN